MDLVRHAELCSEEGPTVNDRIEPMSAQMDQQQFAQQLVESARSEGLELVGPDGVLTG